MKIILQIGQKMDFSKICFIFVLAFTITLRKEYEYNKNLFLEFYSKL